MNHFFFFSFFFSFTHLVIAASQPREDARLRVGSLIKLCAIVPGAEKFSKRCNIEYVRQPWRNAGQRMHCFRANTWYRSENPRTVCVFVSPVLIPSSTNSRVDRFHPTRYLSHLPARIFHCMRLRKITTQRNFLCLWSKIIRKASLAHHKFF